MAEAIDDFDARRRRLLDRVLAHVPFDGWTRTSLSRAARDLGMAPAEHLEAFPDGPADAVALYLADADRRMLEALADHDLAAMKVRERIALAVRIRLQQAAANREAVRRTLAFLALPQHAGMAAECLYRTVDAIWYAAGDTATDFNFYTKRGLLAAVYSSTLLYWLDDTSEDSAKTWAFLDRRIAEVMKVPRMLSELGDRIGRIVGDLPGPWRRFRRAMNR